MRLTSMIPRREALIASLIQYKLSFRRMYRSWRRETAKILPALRSRPPSSISPDERILQKDDDAEDDSTLLKGKQQRPAQLPAKKPDSDVLPVSLLLLLLYVFALIVRLWSIRYPASVVFDEVHFLRFVRAYYHGEYFFDIHPPLGKLVLLTVTYIFCGDPKHEFSRNGEKFGHHKYIPLRVTSALFGAVVPPATYAIGRELGLSSWASLFAACVQVIEHLAVIESRLVLLDGQLMAWMALCLFFALRLWSRPRGKRWRLVIATALTGSAALSVKWTSLATPALVAIISVAGWPFPSRELLLQEIGVAGVVATTFYTILFYIHFRLLPKSGRGDAFMAAEFQQTLIGNQYYSKEEEDPGPGFIRNFLYLNAEMYTANAGIKARHRWESKWWQWIINQRGLLFHNEVSDHDSPRGLEYEKIYLIVNPAVTVITCLAIVIFIFLASIWIIKKWRRRIPQKKSIERIKMQAFVVRGTFLLVGYILNLLPYIEVARCTFLYHYLPALFYALLMVSNLIDVISSLRVQKIVSISLFTAVFIAFIIWKPWIYATPITRKDEHWRLLYGELWT